MYGSHLLAGAPPRTPLGSLQQSPDLLAGAEGAARAPSQKPHLRSRRFEPSRFGPCYHKPPPYFFLAPQFRFSKDMPVPITPCGPRGCKNGPAPFPGRMSYKATKPGLAFVLYLSMFFIVLVFIRALFMYC